ncbi:MAG TPA: 3-hydroxyacyl-CoA dehydrogenase family protein, partial [Syntrophales bacterium]|nr:3-hydroxyacyl-CoA dehydrogenase family protein [Syntrophales bacterium]
IKKAAVLGAGVMGASIAAHLANAGLDCLLLDILPPGLTDEDRRKGWTEETPAWRNKTAVAGLARAAGLKPPAFYTGKNAARIRTGNLEDHLAWLNDADWVIEAVLEDIEVKQRLLARAAGHLKGTCIVSTNTSGLSVRDMAAKAPPGLRPRFLGTHFFNPPRYMRLLELVPTEDTSPHVVRFMRAFCEDVLGKGVVLCRDVPNFIANRMGVFEIANAIQLMIRKNLGIEDVDTLVGRELGRPGTALFGTVDLVGLDTAVQIMTHLYEAAGDDEMRPLFRPAGFLTAMLEKGFLGDKAGRGFYRSFRNERGEKVREVLDYEKTGYVPLRRPVFPSLEEARRTDDPLRKIRVLFHGEDRGGAFVREYLCNNFIYATNRIPGVCDSPADMDRAMKWGYNHRFGIKGTVYRTLSITIMYPVLGTALKILS